MPPTPTPVPPPEPITFEGRGAKTNLEVTVVEGLLVFDIQHTGYRGFAVKLFDKATSTDMREIVNNQGLFKGTVAWGVSQSPFMTTIKPGDYLLGVEATGPWKITMSQPSISEGKEVPLTLTGRGATVTEPFVLAQGPHAFKSRATTNQPVSYFEASIIKADGSNQQAIVSEPLVQGSPVEASKIIGVQPSQAGLYVISVLTDGNWSITIE
jgi:hypothetical protein